MAKGDGEYATYVARMKGRTKSLALNAIATMPKLARNEGARILGRQLLRSASAVGANYRATCRVRTRKEFIAKLRIVCEEADETQYWCELLLESQLGPPSMLAPLLQEAGELTAIFTKALHTARQSDLGCLNF